VAGGNLNGRRKKRKNHDIAVGCQELRSKKAMENPGWRKESRKKSEAALQGQRDGFRENKPKSKKRCRLGEEGGRKKNQSKGLLQRLGELARLHDSSHERKELKEAGEGKLQAKISRAYGKRPLSHVRVQGEQGRGQMGGKPESRYLREGEKTKAPWSRPDRPAAPCEKSKGEGRNSTEAIVHARGVQTKT